MKFTVPNRIRFRKENGFYLVNIRWANTIVVSNEVAEFLIKYKTSGEEFDISNFGKDKKELLAQLFFKDVIESKHKRYKDTRSKSGFSIDPSALPQCA